MKALQDAKISIVGLGLMGGSLAGALRGQCRCVVGVDRNPQALEIGQSRALIDRGSEDLAVGVRGADIVVLSTPVRTILRLLDEIAPLLRPGCLLLDLGSTKTQIVAKMAGLPAHIEPLGGHPMCGKEKSGIESAEATLYRERTFILCPLPRTSPEALAQGQALVKAVGAQPLVLEAARQDFLAGTVSHLPYMLACALISTADATTSADPAVWEIVAGGFRDTSRVSAGNVSMWMDILLTNREEVLRAVATYQAQLAHLAGLLEKGDTTGLQKTLETIREKRLEMFP